MTLNLCPVDSVYGIMYIKLLVIRIVIENSMESGSPQFLLEQFKLLHLLEGRLYSGAGMTKAVLS